MDIEQKKNVIAKALEKYSASHKRDVNIGFGNIAPVTYLKTPFITLNKMMNGGIPNGKFGVIGGPERVAKTTLLLQIIAYNQAINEEFVALWTDTEDALDIDWCIKLGVDIERLIVQNRPEHEEHQHMEELLEEGLAIVKTKAVNMWVIDSIGGLIPKSELDKHMEDSTMLDLQRKFGVFFRKAIKLISPTNDGWLGCPTIFIGQIYDVPSTSKFKITAIRGGNAVKHWAYWRLMARRAAQDSFTGGFIKYTPPGSAKAKTILSGWPQVLTLEKSKMNDQELREVILEFKYGRGLDAIHCNICALIANEVLELGGGGWYKHELLPDGKVRGKEAIFELLTKDNELRTKLVEELDTKIYNNLGELTNDGQMEYTESNESD